MGLMAALAEMYEQPSVVNKVYVRSPRLDSHNASGLARTSADLVRALDRTPGEHLIFGQSAGPNQDPSSPGAPRSHPGHNGTLGSLSSGPVHPVHQLRKLAKPEWSPAQNRPRAAYFSRAQKARASWIPSRRSPVQGVLRPASGQGQGLPEFAGARRSSWAYSQPGRSPESPPVAAGSLLPAAHARNPWNRASVQGAPRPTSGQGPGVWWSPVRCGPPGPIPSPGDRRSRRL